MLGGINMIINKIAKAGTLESNDILIMVMPNENEGIELELESIVMKQFGKQIRRTILDKVEELGVENIVIKAQDKGALDYTIKARIQTAIERAI
jgi:citrate lyase acyl carrier protein